MGLIRRARYNHVKMLHWGTFIDAFNYFCPLRNRQCKEQFYILNVVTIPRLKLFLNESKRRLNNLELDKFPITVNIDNK